MKELIHSRINFDLFKFNIKRNRGLLIVFTLILSLTFPAIVLVNFLSKNSYSISNEDIQLFMVFISIVLILLLVLTPFILFNYLNSKKSVDVFHSLSITRNDLFITYLALSLFFVLVPLTISYWGGFILTYVTSDVGFDPYHVFHFGRLLMVSIAIMAPSIFVIMNTGTLSDSLVYTSILLIAPFITYGAYQLFAQQHIIGFQTANINTLAYLSPIAGVFFIFENIGQTIDGHFIASYWLLLGLAMNCISMNLYKDWKSESSEVPFSNNMFFPLVTSLFIGILFVFLLSINFLSDSKGEFLSFQNLLIPVIFTYALFLILNIIKFRSINTVKKATLNYLILFVTILAITSTFYYTQGFGYALRVPEEEEIVSIDINGTFQGEPFLSSMKFSVESPETIREILNIHEQIVKYIEEDKNLFVEYIDSELRDSLNVYGPRDSYGYLSLTYYLGNNETMKRDYNIPVEIQHMFFGLSDNVEFIHNNHPVSDPSSKVSDEIEVYDPFFTEQYFFDFDLNDVNFKKAIKDDLLSMDEESYYQSEDPIQLTLVYSNSLSNETVEYHDYRTYQLNIDSRFKETLQYINKDRITRTIKKENPYYEVEKASNVSNYWVGYGISQPLQQENYVYYENDGVMTNDNPDVNLDDYRDKIYDKRLSKETNEVLIIDMMYGRVVYPIFED